MTYILESANHCNFCGKMHTSSDSIAQRYRLIVSPDEDIALPYREQVFDFDMREILRVNNECRKRALSDGADNNSAVPASSSDRQHTTNMEREET